MGPRAALPLFARRPQHKKVGCGLRAQPSFADVGARRTSLILDVPLVKELETEMIGQPVDRAAFAAWRLN